MRNIIRIFKSDFKKISRNVVAIVVIMGLTVIPSLYAWLNILSNWDPYGPDATSKIKVAVAADDQGTNVGDKNIKISDNIIESLKSNNTIGWVFPETSQDAIDGVYSGDYYAALIIPEDFTKDMVSFITGDMQHPTIDYYINEKKNAIAPKITDKAQKTVKEQINSTFISQIADSLVGVADGLSKPEAASGDEQTSDKSIVDIMLTSLTSVRDQLSTYDTILDSLISISDTAQSTIDTAGKIAPNMGSSIESEQAVISSLRALLDKNSSASLKDVSSSLSGSLSSIEQILQSVSSAYTMANGDIDKFNQSIAQSKASLESTKQMVGELKNQVSSTIDKLNELKNGEGYEMLSSLLSQDTQRIGEFIASPVEIETQKIYPIDTYGSAMSAFYSVLAIWVGALILVAIIHVQVKPVENIENIKPYEKFFGRYITFFLVGQAQTLLIVLGNLFYIGIQCLNPFKYWFAAAFTSFVFTLFIYSLTVAFENVGEALAVVIMVIQVAGAGGTFPVEVLPQIYQAIYKYLPFTYAMNAFRETIGGMYKADYWKYIGILAVFVLISLFIGLVVSIPCRKLNHIIEKSKKKSGIMS